MQDTNFLQTLRRIVRDSRTENAAYVLSVALLLASLWLPPFSAGKRIFHYDYPVIPKAGGVLTLPDGAQILIPAGALANQLRLKMTSVSGLEFLSGVKDKALRTAAEALSAEPVNLCGDIYRFQAYGPSPEEAILTLPLPQSVSPDVVDVYAWDGQHWNWVPAHAIPEDGVIEAHLDSLSSLAAVVQVMRMRPAIATGLGVEDRLDNVATGHLNEIRPSWFYANEDGSVYDARGANQHSVLQAYLVIPVVSNTKDGVVQPQVLTNILLNPEARSKNITALTMLAVEGMYTGVQLDYLGLDPNLRDEYVSFVQELADALHKQGKILSVRVAQARQVADDRWETGAYDWRALGQVVDVLVIPALESPTAWAPGGPMESLLRWAVGEVNRTKLQIALSVSSCQVVDNVMTRIPYTQALAKLAQVAVEGEKELVGSGEDVVFMLPALHQSGGLQHDKQTDQYWIAYQDEQGRSCQLWLENAASLDHKLQLVADYNVRGLILEHLLHPQNDQRIWDLVKQFRDLFIPSIESDFTVVWTVKGPAGEEVSLASSLAQEGPSGESSKVSVQASTGLSYIWEAPATPGAYFIAAAISDDGGRTTNVRSNDISLLVPSPTPTPTPTPMPTPTPTLTPKPTAKPQSASVSTSASRGPGFDYGIQGDAITDGDHGRLFGLIKQLGFRWYKQQVEWFRYNPAPGQYDWGVLDRIVDSANAAGIKLLFSVVKAPQWARPPEDTDQGPPADPNTYGTFLREMAARYKGRVQAYEIWNEQNLYYEWGGLGGKLNARKYVELLKVAYQAIKSVDPNATVVAGALTPTGYNDGNIAIDDRVYLEQMYQAGLKNYCDAIGAHPSGYNNPPDARWETYQDPSATFNAKGHPSWFFRSTLESYRNIMLKYGDGAKRIWVTEFGWASVENLGVPPARGYEYAADNTEMEQAQFIVKAYQMAKSWGWVGPMFLWNLNFAPICGPQDEKAAFGIIRPDWSPRPAFAALVNMPK